MKKPLNLNKGDRKIALLIDPDRAVKNDWLLDVLSLVKKSGIDVILVGGSLVFHVAEIDSIIQSAKRITGLPVYLFPGHPTQLSPHADGVLFLSLISGRNPELLIGQHVISAPIIRNYNLNVAPTGYMIIGNSATSVHYMSATNPIPANKPDIALATALAGEMLGLKYIYLDGGSGAGKTIPCEMTVTLAEHLQVPLIIGGGIDSPAKIREAFRCGADMVVIGTVIEKIPTMLREIGHDIKV